MRIDPKGAIGGHPALLVRACLRKLRARPSWNLAALEEAASLEAETGKSLLRALSAAGLVQFVLPRAARRRVTAAAGAKAMRLCANSLRVLSLATRRTKGLVRGTQLAVRAAAVLRASQATAA